MPALEWNGDVAASGTHKSADLTPMRLGTIPARLGKGRFSWRVEGGRLPQSRQY
jgi:hypothetical protein